MRTTGEVMLLRSALVVSIFADYPRFLGAYMRMSITANSRIIATGTIRMSAGLLSKLPNIMQ